MEEALKSFNVNPKVLARRSNAMWCIFLAIEQRQTVGRKRPEGEIHETPDRVHGHPEDKNHTVPVDICEYRVGGHSFQIVDKWRKTHP